MPLIPTYRQQLNAKQLHILGLLYKFRFGTTSLFATAVGQKHKQVVYAKLRILVDQGFIGKQYDKSFRLHGKEARYFLLAKGITIMKREPKQLNIRVLKNIANDQRASERFIAHNLNVFLIYDCTNQLYPEQFKFYSKTELANYDYFPEQLPDMYMLRLDKTSQRPMDYFIDSFEALIPFFALKKQVDHYMAYYADRSNNEKWAKTGRPYPVMMTICETEALEQKVRQYITEIFDKHYIADVAWYTSTMKRLNTASELHITKGLWKKVSIVNNMEL